MLGSRWLWVLAALAAAGCADRTYGWERSGPDGASPGPTAPSPAATAGGGPNPAAPATASEAERRAEALWKRRDEREKLAEAVEIWRRAAEPKTADYALLVRLSRAYYLLGELTEGDEAKAEIYDLGAAAAERALDTIPEFHEAFGRTARVEEAVQQVDRGGIEAIYWRAVNVGKWANARGTVKILLKKDEVRRMLERVLALDDRWFYGAAHRYFGAYYAKLPAFAGRDLDRSKDHFQKAIAVEGRYFATRTLYAEFYARTAQDRSLYRQQLELVLALPPEGLPDVEPEQRLEQRRARRLLDETDEHFETEEAP